MKLFLVGMPASGKSTEGRKLAEELKLPFQDLDQLISEYFAASIPEVFVEKGEVPFREAESSLLRQFTEENGAFVLATGGGAAAQADNMAYMNKNGITLWLDLPVELLAERAWQSAGSRPLLKAGSKKQLEERLRTTLESRWPHYALANHRITEPIKNARAVLSSLALLPPSS